MSNATRSPHSFLSKVHGLVSGLLEALPPSQESLQVRTSAARIAQLALPLPELEEFRIDLEARNVSTGCQRAMLQLFNDNITKLQHLYLASFEQAALRLYQLSTHQDGHEDAFRQVLARDFASQVSRAWLAILEQIDTSQACESRSHARVDKTCDSPHDPTEKAGRGHNSDAIRILEQAFRHTPNITQAEKYRLAEVTGLQPKQVTIWFQNRRNRKGKRHTMKEPRTPPPRSDAPLLSAHTPPFPSTTNHFCDKKRKSYGSIGISPSPQYPSTPCSSFSDNDFAIWKKPRIPRSTSITTDDSISSTELDSSFTHWSSPSSRSTSSSSASSSPSGCFDSPGKASNVFRYTNPLKYDVRSKQVMPAVTIATPEQQQQFSPQETLPFTADNVRQMAFGDERRLDFSGLQWDQTALSKAMRESIQQALDMHEASQRSSSSESWTTQTSANTDATDDDGWVDEDGHSAGPQCDVGTYGVDTQRTSMTEFSGQTLSSVINQQAPQWQQQQGQAESRESSPGSEAQYHDQDTVPFGLLSHIFSPSQPSSQPCSQPQLQHLPHQPASSPFTILHQSQPSPDAQNANTYLDFDVDMSDLAGLEELFNTLPPSCEEQQQGQVQEEQGEGPIVGPQVQMNFDQEESLFSFMQQHQQQQ